jgi:hypothetical protein
VRRDNVATDAEIWDESVSLREGSIYNGNRISVELGSATIAIVISLMIVIGACAAVLGMNLSKQMQMDADFKTLKTQEWLVERRLMDKEALDLINGQKLQSDTEFGPTGNLKRMVPHK